MNKKNMIGGTAGIAALVLAGSAFATIPSAYVGGQLGYGNVHTPSVVSESSDLGQPSSSSNTSGGVAGRLFVGYQFNPYIAAELGYDAFSDAKSTAYYNAVSVLPGGNVYAKQVIETQALDLVAKGILPLRDGFNVYGKLGVAYIDQSATDTAVVNFDGTSATAQVSPSAKRLYPTFGLGVSYDINCHLTTDLSWNRIQSTDSDSINSTDLYSVGLIYFFG